MHKHANSYKEWKLIVRLSTKPERTHFVLPKVSWCGTLFSNHRTMESTQRMLSHTCRSCTEWLHTERIRIRFIGIWIFVVLVSYALCHRTICRSTRMCSFCIVLKHTCTYYRGWCIHHIASHTSARREIEYSKQVNEFNRKNKIHNSKKLLRVFTVCCVFHFHHNNSWNTNRHTFGQIRHAIAPFDVNVNCGR